MKLFALGKLNAALVLISMVAACDRPGPRSDVDQVPPQALLEGATTIVEPHRYRNLSNLAGAIRKAGHPCEGVKSYKPIGQSDQGKAVYQIDCMEYSFLLTITNGQSRIEPLTADRS